MPGYTEISEKLTLPVLSVRSNLAFPEIPYTFEPYEEKNTAALAAAEKSNGNIFVVAFTSNGDGIENRKYYNVGTVVKIDRKEKDDNGKTTVYCKGVSRASLLSLHTEGEYYYADVMSKSIYVTDTDTPAIKGSVAFAGMVIKKYTELYPTISANIRDAILAIKDPGILADTIACGILINAEDKQHILECFNPMERLEAAVSYLATEADLLQFELKLHSKTLARISEEQKEIYLREQMQVIKDELGDGDDSEYHEYKKKIMSLTLPDDVRKKLLHENDRAGKLPAASLEPALIRNWLDACLELPWNSCTTDRNDLVAAAKVLEADHDGLDRVKTRILEFLAVKKLNPELKNQIICLVGPPGTGKTSIASSLARAMKRKLVRVSLGGVNDESDIRGHRRTYVASQPGRIISAMSDAKVKNPVMLLDEIDKLCSSYHGDPASALLEVLDPEQNRSFRDHYIDMPFDLSECMFICTANKLDTVPRPLLDRMEVISLSSYTPEEKLRIAKNHLIPKQAKRHGLNGRTLKITDDAIMDIIDHYTSEAGVRSLEREIAAVCRKAAMKIAEDEVKKVKVTPDVVKSMLTERREDTEKLSEHDEIGTVNGLAYTEVGGSLLKIEVSAVPGTGKLELTGSLGDVIKESARLAVGYIRSIAEENGISGDFYKDKDIYIHFPAGAVPKDGPSAGVAITVAIVSALSGRPIRRDIAMTGEVTLHGNVLPIGGLREKVTAAKLAGVKTVLIPYNNMSDLCDIEDVLKAGVEFVPIKYAKQALDAAIIK